MYKNSVNILQTVSTIKTTLLILFKVMLGVWFEDHKKRINTSYTASYFLNFAASEQSDTRTHMQ